MGTENTANTGYAVRGVFVAPFTGQNGELDAADPECPLTLVR